jgi:Carboxypeptidase regulatory-like domain
MKRSLLVVCLSMLLFSLSAMAQQTGRLNVTVQRAATMGAAAAPIAGAKVIIVHWTNPGLHPSMVQEQTATTNDMGMCTVDLPPGTYDIFVASAELAPVAVRREIKAGETTALPVNLRAAPLHFRPVE